MSLSPDSRNKNNWGKCVIYLPPLDKRVLIIFTHYVQDTHCTIGHQSVLLPSKTLKTILVTVAILLKITYVVFKRWLHYTITLTESLQPCSRAARKWRENEKMRRKWRENEKMKRKWRENEQMERKWKEIHSLHFLIFSLGKQSKNLCFLGIFP